MWRDRSSCGTGSIGSLRGQGVILTPSPSIHLEHNGLGRSRSFGGIFVSASRHGPRWTGTWSGGGILGQGYGSPGVPRKLMNSFGTLTHGSGGGSAVGIGTGTGSVRGQHGGHGGTLKGPRPNKARLAVEALTAGLQASVRAAEDELGGIRESLSDLSIHSNHQLQGKIYELEKYSKTSERHLKRLEYQLSRVEELGEEYSLQQKLREGVRAMAYAYSISEGREKETALTNVKAGFRECTEILSSLEAQLEALLGTFKMEMRGIQGFARLCPGDVFEITIKHGLQKWKTRGKVGKDGSQAWDFPKASFRGVLGEVMYIKAAEVKTLGKQILLGNKFCDITELFSAHPQIMTVNLNPSGSLKLSVVVRWSPVEAVEEPIRGGSLSGSGSISPSRKRRLAPSRTSSPSSTLSSEPDQELMNPTDARHSALWERSVECIDSFKSITPSKSPRLYDDPPVATIGDLESDPSGNFSLAKKQAGPVQKPEEKMEASYHGEEEEVRASEMSVRSLKSSVRKLSALLEDIQGQYPELEALELHLCHLEDLIKSPRFCSSTSSLNIESALECFDFLDTVSSVDVKEDGRESPDNPIYNVVSSRYHFHTPSELMDPHMTARTTDSGISSLGHGDSSRTPSPCHSRNSSPNHSLVTGSSQLDAALEAHVFTCLQLVHNLGSFGPLRRREREAVRKLQQQGLIIGSIISRVKDDGISPISSTPNLQELWEAITDTVSNLCTSADSAVHGLEAEIRKVVPDSGLALRVSRLLVQEMLSTGTLSEFQPGDVLTIFQFQLYFKHQHSFKDLVEDLVEEELLLQALQDEGKVISMIQSLSSQHLPPRNGLTALLRLLLNHEPQVKRATEKYFKGLTATRRLQVLELALDLLESPCPISREASCIVLRILDGSEAVEELAYTAQTDKSLAVRRAAKESLIELGEEPIHQQLTLSSHGFQGLSLDSSPL